MGLSSKLPGRGGNFIARVVRCEELNTSSVARAISDEMALVNSGAGLLAHAACFSPPPPSNSTSSCVMLAMASPPSPPVPGHDVHQTCQFCAGHSMCHDRYIHTPPTQSDLQQDRQCILVRGNPWYPARTSGSRIAARQRVVKVSQLFAFTHDAHL